MPNYSIRHKSQPIRRTTRPRGLIRQASVVANKPKARAGKAPVRQIVRPIDRVVKTGVTKEAVEARKREVQRVRGRKTTTKTRDTIQVNAPRYGRPVVVGGGMKSGRRERPKLSRQGRGDLRHTVRSAQRQKILRAHVNKIKEIKGTGHGKVLVMLACGPSVNEVDFAPLKDHPFIDIMCINKPNKQVWPSTYWSFCDLSQYNRNKEYWKAYNGIVWNSQGVRVPHPKQIIVKNRSGQGFSKDLTSGYFISRTTTYASMQVAAWLNYNRVYIFGCDMGAVNGQMHYYGKNPDVDDSNRIKRFAKEAEAYNFAASGLSKPERDRFVFCSAYNKFPFTHKFGRLDHLTAIPVIMEFANNLAKK